MDKFLRIASLIIALLLFDTLISNSYAPTLVWNMVTDSSVCSIKIYDGTNSHAYFECRTLPNNTNRVTITNLTYRLYFFAATCVTSNSIESLPSNEVYWLNIPNRIIWNPRYYTDSYGNNVFGCDVTNTTGYQCIIQSTTNLLSPWKNISTNVTPFSFLQTNSGYNQLFFRCYYTTNIL